jgi:hypothetical protein
MNPFPQVDPIPLPAPIWLFKLLHIVTLSLHFVAVEMLLGGLLLAVGLSLFKNSPAAATTARALARRLTVVMTYVINLGVPPLLFAQVLYERADWHLLDRDCTAADAVLLASVPVFSSARQGQIGLVDRTDCMADRGRHCTLAVDQYDTDAATRGLARHVFRIGGGALFAASRSNTGATLADDAGGRIVYRRFVACVPGRPFYIRS